MMQRYEIESMFGQGTFGRLYKAHLRSDLCTADLPAWLHQQVQRREEKRREEERRRREEREEEGDNTMSEDRECQYADDECHEECVPHVSTSSSTLLSTLRAATLVIKEVPFQGLPPQEQQDILNEVRVMSAVNHSSFIAYYESFLDNGCLYIVMELAEGGDLGQLLSKNKPNPMPECEMWRYLLQLLEGLSYLHAQRIIHRDIKPANIFLDSSNNCKIGDLGLGRILGSKSVVARTGVGTPLYFSPELCMDQPYDEKSDIWSLGCLLYEMATFTPPFLATNQIALAKKIVNDIPAQLPLSYSSELRFLIMKMLEKDASKRPSIDQMLQYSPVKLRRQHSQLRQTIGRLTKRIKHQHTFIQINKDRQRQNSGNQQQQINKQQQQIKQEQDKAMEQAKQAQKDYQQVCALYESAESARSSLMDRLYEVESESAATTDRQQQLFEQYQLQLAREQQEKKQMETIINQQQQQIEQQQQEIDANKHIHQQLKQQMEQLHQQLQQLSVTNIAPHSPPTRSTSTSPPPLHLPSSPSAHFHSADSPTVSSFPLLTDHTSSPSLLPLSHANSPTHQQTSIYTPHNHTQTQEHTHTKANGQQQHPYSFHTHTVAASVLPLPSPSLPSTYPSPHPSPSLSRVGGNKVCRTPYLGPAIRVPVQINHTSPNKNTTAAANNANNSSTHYHSYQHGAVAASSSSSSMFVSGHTPPKKKFPVSLSPGPSLAPPSALPKLDWSISPLPRQANTTATTRTDSTDGHEQQQRQRYTQEREGEGEEQYYTSLTPHSTSPGLVDRTSASFSSVSSADPSLSSSSQFDATSPLQQSSVYYTHTPTTLLSPMPAHAITPITFHPNAAAEWGEILQHNEEEETTADDSSSPLSRHPAPLPLHSPVSSSDEFRSDSRLQAHDLPVSRPPPPQPHALTSVDSPINTPRMQQYSMHKQNTQTNNKHMQQQQQHNQWTLNTTELNWLLTEAQAYDAVAQ